MVLRNQQTDALVFLYVVFQMRTAWGQYPLKSPKFAGNPRFASIQIFSISYKKAVKYEISQLFVVDLKGFEPSTSRMRMNQKLWFVLIFSHFRRFCLECKWSCGLFFPL